MSPLRRRWLARLAAAAWLPAWRPSTAAAASPAAAPAPPGVPSTIDPVAGEADAVRRGRPITFPADHGAHLAVRTEWWYATGWLAPASTPPNTAPTPTVGFQVTFFRSRTGLAPALAGRFAPRQLLFAHAAITDLAAQRHLHDQRIVRWSGAADAATGRAAVTDADVHIGDWSLRREPGASAAAARWVTHLPARDFELDLLLQTTQAPLLQGDAGFSRKGPQESQASHYYSLPQLATSGRAGGRANAAAARNTGMSGRAWLDHEWSDQILHPQAVGWDWIGMNLFDGSALTAFVLRRRDGSTLWAGGSFRAPGQASRSFGPEDLRWTPGRVWRSAGSGASYPVQCRVQTPVGTFSVNALLDAQELDSRGSTGTVYWEGLSELLDAGGRRLGLGYLEMTGYAGAIKLN